MNLKKTTIALASLGAVSSLTFVPVHSNAPLTLGEVAAIAGKGQSKGGWRYDAQGNAYKSSEILVRIKSNIPTSAFEAAAGNLAANVAFSTRVLNDPVVPDLFLLHVDEQNQMAVMKALKAMPEVIYAEPNYQVKATATIPSDTKFNELWGLNNTGQTGGTPDADIDAPEAWDKIKGSRSVVVAVIDTGVDYTHNDLARNIWSNPREIPDNGLDDDNNGVIDDIHGINVVGIDPSGPGCAGRPTAGDPIDDGGHGTHVSGTIGAFGNNGRGVAGVNWNVSILAAKFLDASGSGTTVGAIMALQYVYTMKTRGVNIVATNNSWGGGAYSRALLDAIDRHRQAGILFIAAAGNDGSDNDLTSSYPSSYDLTNVISVAATDHNDALASFSNWGKYSVDVGAPGADIVSTCSSSLFDCASSPDDPYALFSGTSMATPHVTGLAALLKAQAPTRDWRRIRNLILSTVDPKASLNGKTTTGGRINAAAAVNCAAAPRSNFSILSPTPQSDVMINRPVILEAQNIRCETGAGAVTATPAGGSAVSLKDDGVYPDRVAGDGIYSGAWTPTAAGNKVIAFNNGSITKNVTVAVTPFIKYTFSNVIHSFTDISATGTAISTGNDGYAIITSPFPLWLYGKPSTSLVISANGAVSQSCSVGFVNSPLPVAGSGECNLASPFWDDIEPSSGGGVYWQVAGTAPNRILRVQWNNAPHYDLGGTNGVTFQVEFNESASWNTPIFFRYKDVIFGNASYDKGASATVGAQRRQNWAQQFSYNTASLADNLTKKLTPAGVIAPLADADPLSVPYYRQLVGMPVTQKVWLTNTGNTNLTVSTLAISGSADFTLVTPPATPFAVAPGKTVPLQVRYLPLAAGSDAGTLQIGTNGGNVAVDLSGTGVAEPDIDLSTGTLNYGAVTVGSSLNKVLTIFNRGKAPLRIDDIDIPAPFSIVGALPPYSIAPGSSLNLTVKFAPTAVGIVSKSMYIYSSDPDEAAVKVTLLGSGQ